MAEPVLDSGVAYSLEEAAYSLGVSLTNMEDLVAAGTVPSLKVGRRRLVRPEALEQYVLEQQQLESSGVPKW